MALPRIKQNTNASNSNKPYENIQGRNKDRKSTVNGFIGERTLETSGLFSATIYACIDEPYENTKSNEEKLRNTNKFVVQGISKSKCANQDGYFGDTFQRIMESEPLKESNITKANKDMTKNSSKISPPFYTSAMRSIGQIYAEIEAKKTNQKHSNNMKTNQNIDNKKIENMQNKSKGTYVSKPKQFITNPSKKGTGYGYVDVTLSKYPSHMSYNIDKSKTENNKIASIKDISNHNKKLARASIEKPIPFRTGGHALDEKKNNNEEINKEDIMRISNKKRTSKLTSNGQKHILKKFEETQSDKPIFKPAGTAKKIGGGKFGAFSDFKYYSDGSQNSKDKLGKIEMTKKSSTSGNQQIVVNYKFIPTHGKKSYYTRSIVNYSVEKLRPLILSK